ncbi:hypothetical protein D9M70_643990 [compost metagenome]
MQRWQTAQVLFRQQFLRQWQDFLPAPLPRADAHLLQGERRLVAAGMHVAALHASLRLLHMLAGTPEVTTAGGHFGQPYATM